MNNATIIFRYSGDILPEEVVSNIVSIIRNAVHTSDDISVVNATDKDFEDLSNIGLMKVVKDFHKPKQDMPSREFNSVENAIMYIYGIFNGSFAEMFPTRLAIKLHGRPVDDPLVKAVRIIGDDSSSYHNLSAYVRNKYKISKQIFEEIQVVSRMLYNLYVQR